MTVFIFSIIGIYTITLIVLIIGYFKLSTNKNIFTEPTTRFSIIIPFRNEADSLPDLLMSLNEISYPANLYELIFVDDESTDPSVSIISEHRAYSDVSIKILSNRRFSAAPKKDAISTAIEQASFEWIITTDADCIIPPSWLSSYNSLIKKEDPFMVAGSVSIQSKKNLLGYYQIMEGLSLQLVTMGSFGLNCPILCNGANLAYTKGVFNELRGFYGNNHLPSGDDIFMMEKIRKHYPERLVYLNSLLASVRTKSEDSWQKVIRQRVRWASKTTHQPNILSKLLGFIVILTNISLLTIPIWWVILPQFYHAYIIFLGSKFLVDLAVIATMANHFKKWVNWIYFAPNFILYPVITILVANLSLFDSYEWKGRTFSKQS